MAPFQGPGVRPDVLSPKNVWFCLRCAQKALKWGFSVFGESYLEVFPDNKVGKQLSFSPISFLTRATPGRSLVIIY